MDVAKKNRIYLTGFMGSGKSTITPILANTLGYKSIDIDEEIVNITKKRIAEIFSEMGEEYFRKIERSILQEISQLDGYVVSLGGGTIADPTNFSIIKSTGILIYLKSSSEQIFNRMKNKTDRPLLRINDDADGNDELLRSKIMKLLEKREVFYNQAEIIISTDDKKIGKTVDEIVSKLNAFLK